jgi:hypothetical protein
MILLVYKTDSHHSYHSREIIGVATSNEEAISICVNQSRRDDEEFDGEQMYNLRNIKQTQDYSGEGEFQYEEVKTNTLL